jgi:UDP-galactopyranose mutase
MFAVVGAGFAGAVLARELAEAGHPVNVLESRSHVAGNCHTARHDNGVMVHRYGPHIFHTGHEHVWEYICRFGEMEPYVHRVRAVVGERTYSLPINLTTINQFFGTSLDPEEAEQFIADRCTKVVPVTFVDQALSTVGPELYAAFFEGYTSKQWGRDPSDLPASVLARLPVRFTDDDRYFDHRYQGIPKEGYTAIVERLLDHPAISVETGTTAAPGPVDGARHTFWTGPIDSYFGHAFGRLGYRTLDFEFEALTGNYQDCPVVNYCDVDVPYTRITEYRHFAPAEDHQHTVISREYSRQCEPDDIPYYPVRLAHERAQLQQYVEAGRQAGNVSFLGRLGTYRYVDMDVTIHESLRAAAAVLQCMANNQAIPAFFTDPDA